MSIENSKAISFTKEKHKVSVSFYFRVLLSLQKNLKKEI